MSNAGPSVEEGAAARVPRGAAAAAESTLAAPITPRALLDSPEFTGLVRRRWRMSLILTALLFVAYYGYIVLIATNRALLSTRIGETTTLGIPLGAAVIVVSWILTAAYVVWANRHYDPEVTRLRNRLH